MLHIICGGSKITDGLEIFRIKRFSLFIRAKLVSDAILGIKVLENPKKKNSSSVFFYRNCFPIGLCDYDVDYAEFLLLLRSLSLQTEKRH